MHKKVTVHSLNVAWRETSLVDVNHYDEYEARYLLLKLVASHPDRSQRRLADGLGISLGKLKYCLGALIDRGLVKVGRFAQSENKLGYRYLLTSRGIKERTVVTLHFLRRKEAEFKSIKREIKGLRRELRDQDTGKFA